MKFNANNTGYITGDYPLFLGDDLGIIDTINVKYPQLEELYQLQYSQMWNELEVDLTQDRMDMMECPKDTVDLMVKTIMWQTLADTVAARSIIETLGEYVSNSELMNLLTLWSFTEVIHARTYSHIIKQTFTDPNQMLRELYSEAGVLTRSEIIVKIFDEMSETTKYESREVVLERIVKTITALFALEAIAFMSSFAVTFAITETGVFQGIGKDVTLICRDEVLHTRMDYTILEILKSEQETADVLEELKPEIKQILDEVVAQEIKWADYLFSDGRSVIGLNSILLKEYTLWMAKPLYDAMGVDYEYKIIPRNPLPYMEKYIDSSKMQAAPQEIQITSYKTHSIKDDSDGVDLDFEF